MRRTGEAEDVVFRALADPTRRGLLDALHATAGMTLVALCGDSGMTRQAVAQHLAVLEAANLVSSVRRGREKRHYLNPVPIHELHARWISKFEQPRLDALHAVRQRLEETMTTIPSFVYVTYIGAPPERVWHALTDPDFTARYWDHRNTSTWEVGARWEHVRLDGETVDGGGVILELDPPRRLVHTWGMPGDPPSRVTFDLEPIADATRLTVTHDDFRDDAERRDVSDGWAKVLSNLKSVLETGDRLPALW